LKQKEKKEKKMKILFCRQKNHLCEEEKRKRKKKKSKFLYFENWGIGGIGEERGGIQSCHGNLCGIVKNRRKKRRKSEKKDWLGGRGNPHSFLSSSFCCCCSSYSFLADFPFFFSIFFSPFIF